MKLTEENQDYMDCRPPIGQVDPAMVPDYMRAGIAKRAAARAAEKAVRAVDPPGGAASTPGQIKVPR
jgi:hypothetical protein